MVSVEFSHLTKSFGTNKILDDISLSVNPGEFLVLVGPSGCGKSTLLRCLAGLEHPDSGDILVNKKSVVALEPRERQLSMVFQNYALYPHMDIFDNLAFGLRMRKRDNPFVQKKVAEVAELLRLTKYLKRKPKELSGGQRQRVALGRALATEAPLLLFDEPLSNLDAHLRSKMRFEIKKIHQHTRSTVIYVTHDQVEATTMADRLAILNFGKVIQVDTPKNVFNHPLNQFVAQFIGSPEMNLVAGELCGFPKEKVGFRPEEVIVSGSGSENGEVELVEFLGAQQLVFTRWKNQSVKLFSSVEQRLSPGQKIHFDLPKEKLHRFDAESGRRLN